MRQLTCILDVRITGPYQRASFHLSIRIIAILVQCQWFCRVLVQFIVLSMVSIQFEAIVTPMSDVCRFPFPFLRSLGPSIQVAVTNGSSPVVQWSCSNIHGISTSVPTVLGVPGSTFIYHSRKSRNESVGAKVLGPGSLKTPNKRLLHGICDSPNHVRGWPSLVMFLISVTVCGGDTNLQEDSRHLKTTI